MKKLRLLALGMLGLSTVFLTSCEDDETPALEPALTVVEVGGATSSSDELIIEEGSSLVFVIDARKGDADLDDLTVEVVGVNAPSSIPSTQGGVDFNNGTFEFSSTNDNSFKDTIVFQSAGLNTGLTEYTFTVIDVDGEVATVSHTVRVEPATTPLSADKSFTWKRVGGAAGTGLGQFGLKWTQNTGTSAIVAEDAATRFVELSAGSYTSITTKQDLAAAIANGTSITQYSGVSSTQSQSNINDVLGVTYQGEDYILIVQSSTVTSGSTGTTIEIMGMYKN